ncbi:hypothetical protein CHLRE_16g653550v5 [Chlamydomonas reinhardtii]|uniref:Uncharacterized protein n=1 Tax=Chlamydomonas reinhardtii TaxID=3055 RepID=A0A2K3CT07_CHLRE|nr:uncharacterized protein CHLRE_16g653550v5 [Chlamydomonas reinhardtii]PNW71420.1 hypothetical protein CHLRE_16g653550v5 [Chlamydomonas reinhardtii]
MIAEVLNEEYKPKNPASLLQVLDREGWGVHTEIARRFFTKFASLTLEGSWDDDLTGEGRVESRRLALLAVFQEWLVARSSLVGRLLDGVERLRPGYLPADLVQRVRAARSSGAYLTPDSEALDGPALLQLAVLVLPPEQVERITRTALEDTRAEVLALPSYRGRADLVPALDRGLALLAAGCGRTAETARFRAAHVREVLTLQAELRRRQQKKQEGQQEGNSLMAMWVRQPTAAKPSGPDTTARSATDRLYAGQLAPEAHRWMAPADRAAAAAAAPGTTGPRGLPAGRCGRASFRPAPGVTLCGEPGSPGCGSFGGCDRLAFNALDAAMLDLLARAKTQVPAAAMATFARLHRTALLDALSDWQWRQLVVTGEAAHFFQDRCAHAAAFRPAGPLLVGRHTRVEVAPGPELESLRALARRRGAEVLDIVSPLARKQVVSAGEWDYWREAYRLWDRFTSMPPAARGSRLALVLTSEQLPRVLADAAAAAGANGGTAAAAAAAAASAAAAAEDLDISSLTSMSSLDLDDAPLPAGILTPDPTPGTSTGAGSSASGAPAFNPGSSSTGSPTTSTGSNASSSTSGASNSTSSGSGAAPLETAALVAVPPAELRAFMSALLTLLPAHVGEAAAAAFGGAGSGSSMAGGGVASSSSSSGAGGFATRSMVGEWLPARATCLQIRYCPPTADDDDDDDDDGDYRAETGKRAPAPLPPLAPLLPASGGGAAAAAAASPPPLHEEHEYSCYELRWAEGALTLNSGAPGTTLSSAASPALAATVRSALLPSGKGQPLGGRWCHPVRLTAAQLVSLVNICTDVAQQVPDLYGLQQPRLIVPTLTPLERLRVAAQGAAQSAWRLVGLLALLAVPLAAAIKAGGGDLNAMMAAAATAPPPPATSRDGSAAASTNHLGLPHVARSTPSAFADGGGGAPPAALAAARRPPSAAAKATVAALAGATSAELVTLCRRVEGRLEGRMWLEVTNTAAATGAAAATTAALTEAEGGPAAAPQPEFQVVLDRVSGAVLGCKPVNAAGMAVYPEFPLAAELRGRRAAAALDKHLSGLSRERIERGKATPGSFRSQYRPVDYAEPSAFKQQQQPQQSQPQPQQATEASSPPAAGSESSATAAAGAGGVVVLKAELRPATEPGRRVVQGKGKRQREFAAAEVVVRPWYDSDSLLRWMDAGVQLPSLGQEIASGLLAAEETQRQAFLDEYNTQMAPLAAAAAAAARAAGVVVTIDNSASANASGAGGGGATPVHPEAAGSVAGTGGGVGATGSATAAASAAGAGEGRVLQPQELSEQQLQEALKQLFSVLGMPAGSVSIASGAASGTGTSAPKP